MPRDLPAIHDTFQANKDEIRAYAVDQTMEYDHLIREVEIFYPKSEDWEDMAPEDYNHCEYE